MTETKDKMQHAKKAEAKTAAGNEKLIAIVRVRGIIGVDCRIDETLTKLNLHKRNFCSIFKETPDIKGMILMAKDYITWGEIDEHTLKELIEKKGEPNPKDNSRTKPFFRLNCPRKGFGRKGVKVPFNKRGALGDRGIKINALIKNMLH